MQFAPILMAGLGWIARFLMVGLVVAMGDMIADVILSLISSFLNIAANAIEAAGIELPPAPEWGDLPLVFLQVAKRCGFDVYFTVIVAALAIRWIGRAFSAVYGLRRGVPS